MRGIPLVKINAVLSLFDGISCGQVALDRAGILHMSYYASEVDKYAIQVTQCNYPNTIQLGDVRLIDSASLPTINLLLGGSPCQSFSSAGSNTGFNGKSGLLYEYVRLLKNCKLFPIFILIVALVIHSDMRQLATDGLSMS